MKIVFHSPIVFWCLLLLRTLLSPTFVPLQMPCLFFLVAFKISVRCSTVLPRNVSVVGLFIFISLRQFLKLRTQNSRKLSALISPSISFLPHTFTVPLLLLKFHLSVLFFSSTHAHTPFSFYHL